MTEKQKQAIRILNNLNERCGDNVFNEEDYFILLEFVVGEPQLTYIPFTQTPPQPIDPIYGNFGKVTCTQNIEE